MGMAEAARHGKQERGEQEGRRGRCAAEACSCVKGEKGLFSYKRRASRQKKEKKGGQKRQTVSG